MATKNIAPIGNAQLGSFIIRNHAPHFKGKTTALMLSYLIAKEFYNPDFGYAFPPISKLALMMGLKERQIITHLNVIRDAKDDFGMPLWIIKRGYQVRSGEGVSNRYFPTFALEASIWKDTPEEKNTFVDWQDLDSEPTTEDSTDLDDGDFVSVIEQTSVETQEHWDSERSNTLRPGAHTELISPPDGGVFTKENLPSEVPQTVEELEAVWGHLPRAWTTQDFSSFDPRTFSISGDEWVRWEVLRMIFDYSAYSACFDEATKRAAWTSLNKRNKPGQSNNILVQDLILGALNNYVREHPEGINIPVMDTVDTSTLE